MVETGRNRTGSNTSGQQGKPFPKRPRRGRLRSILGEFPNLAERLERLRQFSSTVRSSEYHVTNACNLRCHGCWFFEHGFDRATCEESDLSAWRRFAQAEAEKGITAALLIGGEPTLFLDRVTTFVEAVKYVTVSTNGIRPLPKSDFSHVAIAVTMFGGHGLDDQLRAIRPNGTRFSGLFDQALRNYKDDARATYILALTPESVVDLEETVGKIAENGNQVTFNHYSEYGAQPQLRFGPKEQALLDEALRIKDAFPETVVCDSYFIEALLTGKAHHGQFGYAVCPSISRSHPAHAERLRNGNPTLPGFDVWAADLSTVEFCCTSGNCESCRDSQAVYSWLVSSAKHYLRDEELLRKWLDLAESYWSQFVWSPYHRSAGDALV